MKISVKGSFVGSIVLVSALGLAACSPANQEDSTTTTESSSAASTTTSSSTSSNEITISDAVVRASVEGSPMTAIFGTVENNTDEDITVTGFTASVDAAKFEIHEVVDGVMQQKPGGLPIPAGETHEMAPGGDHLMVMGLTSPIEAGDTVDVTLILEDGTEVEVADIPVRTIAAGDENYGDDGEVVGHDGVEHSEHSDQ